MKDNVAIIPARGGSRRIRFKNKKIFFGKPIIAHAILTAKKSSLFKKIIVSTDDLKIAKISKKYGASVDFVRPKFLSKNEVGILRVIKHAIMFYEKKKLRFKNICCILPVSPLLNIQKIKKGYKLLKSKNVSFVFSATVSNPKNKKFFILNEKKKIEKIIYKFRKDVYSDAGQYYWGKKLSWINERKIFSYKSLAVKMTSDEAIDVNDMKDWKNLIIRYKNKKR